MNTIQKYPIEPLYKKDNGLYILDIDSIRVPFQIKERSVVYIPPDEFGGNHKHPRQEAFIGIGKGLELIWIQNNKKVREKMNPKGKTFLFIVSPYLGHVVINNSKKEFGILIEFADDFQKDVENCTII